MKDSRPNLPRPSQIVGRMLKNQKYSPTQIAFMFDSNLALTQKLLKQMLDDGVIEGIRERGRERVYFLPVIQDKSLELAGPRVGYAFSPPLSDSLAKERNAFIDACMAARGTSQNNAFLASDIDQLKVK